MLYTTMAAYCISRELPVVSIDCSPRLISKVLHTFSYVISYGVRTGRDVVCSFHLPFNSSRREGRAEDIVLGSSI